jgi:cell division septation protein DedD
MSASDDFEAIGAAVTGAQRSAMFGKPCWKLDGKAFACLFQDCMVFKLASNPHASALSLRGSTLFDPSGSGRAMKEWVQVVHAHRQQWPVLARAAADYVQAAARSPKPAATTVAAKKPPSPAKPATTTTSPKRKPATPTTSPKRKPAAATTSPKRKAAKRG